jgi:hypothetical protein
MKKLVLAVFFTIVGLALVACDSTSDVTTLEGHHLDAGSDTVKLDAGSLSKTDALPTPVSKQDALPAFAPEVLATADTLPAKTDALPGAPEAGASEVMPTPPPSTDAKTIGFPCEIPSPTGDELNPNMIMSPTGEVLVPKNSLSYRDWFMAAWLRDPTMVILVEDDTYEKDVCVNWKERLGQNPRTTYDEDLAACQADIKKQGLPEGECLVTMTADQCNDVAHDMVDSLGVPHGFSVSFTTCLPSFNGVKGCFINERIKPVTANVLFSILNHGKGRPICTVGGKFVGWSA